MNIKIQGRPISKKNSRKAIHVRGRTIMIPSDAYKNFASDALAQLGKMQPLKPPYAVSYLFRMKGRMDTDIDNMIAGINDILQEAGAIKDDKFITNISATKISGCDEWLSEIRID